MKEYISYTWKIYLIGILGLWVIYGFQFGLWVGLIAAIVCMVLIGILTHLIAKY